jgi:hypothetical protein
LVHVACGLEERGTNLNRNPDRLADNFSSWLTASNKRVDIMGDELSSLSNDGRITTEKSGHIFLIVIDRPKKLKINAIRVILPNEKRRYEYRGEVVGILKRICK